MLKFDFIQSGTTPSVLPTQPPSAPATSEGSKAASLFSPTAKGDKLAIGSQSLFSTDKTDKKSNLFEDLFKPVTDAANTLFNSIFRPTYSSYSQAKNSSLWSSLVRGTSSSSGRSAGGIDFATINRANNAPAGTPVVTPPSVENIALLNALNGTPVVDSRGFKISDSERTKYEGIANSLKSLYNNTGGLSVDEVTAQASKLVGDLLTMDPVYALVMASSLASANYTTLAAGIIEQAKTRENLKKALAVLDGQFEAPALTREEQVVAKQDAERYALELNEPLNADLPDPQVAMSPQELSPYAYYGAMPLAPLGADRQEPTRVPLTPENMGALIPLSPPQSSNWLPQSYQAQV